MSRNPKDKLQQEKLHIYGIYSQLIEGIKHYDNIQAVLRSMTSTLLLASFAVIGFLFTSKVSVLHINNLLCIIFSGILSLVGITSLGLLDLVFQERLLVANLVEAIHLENRNKWLFSTHNNMLQKGSHHGSPIRKATFYIGCSCCMIFIVGLTTFFMYGLENALNSILISITTIGFAIFYGYFFSKITGRFEALTKEILESPKIWD